MADGAISAEDSPDDDSDFSRTCTTNGHRKRPDDDSDLGRTRTATGQKKRSLISQTAAQREERLAVERLQHIPFFILLIIIIHVPCHIHHLAYCTYSHFPLSFLCYYSSIKFINCCMIEVRGMSYALCVCLVKLLWCCVLPLALETKWYIIWSSLTFSLLLLFLFF